MSSKRKRVVLTLGDKLDILDALKRGESAMTLSDKYGIGQSTISNMKKHSDTIMKFANHFMSDGGRKVMKTANNDKLDECIFMWFMQRRSSGQPVSGLLLCEKAMFFNSKLNGDSTFKASSGWLQKFKRRYGIHLGSLLADISTPDAVIDMLTPFLEKEGFHEEFIYNADTTVLNWKELPDKSLTCENTAPLYNISEERVTVMVCANAAGRHRLPLLVIGKLKNPRCFRNIKNLPVEYDHQKKCWMNATIFKRWYEKQFIPEVKKYQNSIGKKGKTVLLLENVPSYPSIEYLNQIDEMFIVKLLPPNVTLAIQPMNQGVIAAFIRSYRIQILKRLLFADDYEDTVVNFYKKINLKDFCYMAADSWNSLDTSTLNNSWNKILKRPLVSSNNTVEKDMEDIKQLLAQISTCDECNNDVTKWLNSDANDPRLQILSDDEIIKEISESKDQDQEEEEEIYEGEDVCPTHSEAFRCLDVAIKWFEEQEECNPEQLMCLKNIQDLVAFKRTSSFKRELIFDLFNKK